jgi:regulatory protein
LPGTISRITVQVRDPERVSLFIDGEFAFGLPAIEVMKRGLKRGDELTQADIEQLLAVDEIERAVTAALTFVSYRPRSEREVRDRLRLRDFSQPAIDQAVERMRGWKYLDDQAFARWWVENRGEHRPRGKRLLAGELRTKGVPSEVINEVIEEAEIDEFPAALEVARKRMGSLSNLDRQAQERRLGSYLARRGYGWDVVGPVLKTLFAEADEAE